MNIDMEVVRSFAERRYGALERMTAKRLSGGLDSFGVYRIDVKFAKGDSAGTAQFVAKHLAESGTREADVYRLVAASPASMFAPRLLGTAGGSRDTYLFLQWIPPNRQWPWRDQNATLAVLRRLAQLHSQPLTGFGGVSTSSTFESEMQSSAASTAELYGRAFFRRRGTGLRPMRSTLRRISDDLLSIRRYLIQETGAAPLHGDMHSGNVIIRTRKRRTDAMLLDWGRARIGSPLEDVASWLHSLGYWEPEVKRLHDTFIGHYLEWAGRPRLMMRDFRKLYWLASASNAMAGALHYHFETMLNPAVSVAVRESSAGVARDWLRIIRRADHYWRLGDAPGPRIATLRSGRRQNVTL
jgi:hypothetical protein